MLHSTVSNFSDNVFLISQSDIIFIDTFVIEYSNAKHREEDIQSVHGFVEKGRNFRCKIRANYYSFPCPQHQISCGKEIKEWSLQIFYNIHAWFCMAKCT